MSNNVVSIFKYMPRDMGQCPECRGYYVQPNCAWILAEKFPDEPELLEAAIEHDGNTWHCLECDCRW